MLSKLLTLAFALLGLIQVPAQSPRLTRPVKIGGDSGAYRVLLLADGAIVAEGTFPTSTETSEHLVVLDVHGRIIPRLPQEVVSVLAALADGSLLAWVSVTNKFQVHHLKPDGSLDLEFAARFGTNSISSALPQPDGKILVIGNFDGRFSQLRRIQPDGSLDRDFRDHLIAESQLSEVWGVTVQLDGRIVVQNGSSLPRRWPDSSLMHNRSPCPMANSCLFGAANWA